MSRRTLVILILVSVTGNGWMNVFLCYHLKLKKWQPMSRIVRGIGERVGSVVDGRLNAVFCLSLNLCLWAGIRVIIYVTQKHRSLIRACYMFSLEFLCCGQQIMKLYRL